MAAGAVALGTASGPTVVLSGLFLMGAASATMNTVGMVYLSSGIPPSRRGVAMGVFSAALLGGQALGPAASGLLADAAGWRSSMLAAAAVSAGVGLGGSLSRRQRPHGSDTALAAPTDAIDSLSDVRPPSRPQRAVINAVPFGVFFMLGALMQTLVPIIGSERLGLSAAQIGVALGLGGLCRFLGAIVGGVVSDRISRNAALLPGLCLAGVGVGLLGAAVSYALWIAAIVLLSVSSYGVAVGATILADHSRPGEVGRAMGRYRVYGDFGMMVGPITATVVFDRFGQAVAALGVAGLLFGIAAAAVVVLCQRPRTAGT